MKKRIILGSVLSILTLGIVFTTNTKNFVKAEDLETGISNPIDFTLNNYAQSAKDYLNSLNLDKTTLDIFIGDVVGDKANFMFKNFIDVETWKQSVNKYINENKSEIEQRKTQETYIKSLNLDKNEEEKMVGQIRQGLVGVGGNEASWPTQHKTMSLWMGGGYANIPMHLHHRGDIVVNIAGSRESGGGNIWSGPHGHFYEGHVNSVSNPVLTVSWINQINDIAPITLSWKEGWANGSVVYGRGSIYNYGLGHQGIDVGYGANRRVAIPEEEWVGQMNLNGNLKQVVIVDRSQENAQHPFYYGISHATYLDNGGKTYNTNNIPLIANNVSPNSIAVYASCGLSYRTTYVSPSSFGEQNIYLIPNSPTIINRMNGCSQIQFVSPNGYIFGGYIRNSDYDWLNNNSRKIGYEEYQNTIKDIRIKSDGHAKYDRNLPMYEFSANERRNDQAPNVGHWYQQNNLWYYQFPDGSIARQATWLYGHLYGFDPDGHLYENRLYTFNNITFYAGANGISYLDRWLELNGKLYYFQTSGESVVSKWFTKNGRWYHTYADGSVIRQATWLYGCLYGFDHDGHLYENQLYTFNNITFYAGENGKSYLDRWLEKDGKLYYFQTSGESVVSKWFTKDGKWYHTHADGSLIRQTTWLYGNLYGFDHDGHLYENRLYTFNNITFYAGANGISYLDKWLEKDGKLYYFQTSGESVVSKWFTKDGKWYYAFADGSLARTITKIGDKLFGFNENGQVYVNSWFTKNNKWYYVNGDGSLQTQATWINGNLYGFNQQGEMQENSLYTFNNITFYAGEHGISYLDKWLEKDGKLYYFQTSGESVVSKWFTKDGKWYHTHADGSLIRQTTWLYGNLYGFDHDGHLYENRLYTFNNITFYAGANGISYLDKWLEKDGKLYYFKSSGESNMNTWFEKDGKKYYATSDGSIARSNTQIGNKLYAFDENSQLRPSGWFKHNNKWYYVNGDGSLQTQATWINGNLYGFNQQGEMQENSLYTFNNITFYAGANGISYLDKWLEKDGKLYYFQTSGESVVSKWFTKDGKWYHTHADGSLIRQTTWLYGNLYGFDHDGHLYENQLYRFNNMTFYAGEHGISWLNRTLQLNGKVYNFNQWGECLQPI